eukprot:gene37133-59846_t
MPAPLPPLMPLLTAALPLADFATVPVATWGMCAAQRCGMSVVCGTAVWHVRGAWCAAQHAAATWVFAARPFVVFEKDMARDAAPEGAAEERKIAAAAAAVRAASRRLRPSGPPTQVYMYQTVGSLLPQYATSRWFAERPELLLHDDSGRVVTVTIAPLYTMMGRTVVVPWVDFAQQPAAEGWVDNLFQWVANGSVDGIALDGNPYDDEWIRSRRLGGLIAGRAGVLMANGVHLAGDNGMLFEEWCAEHSYLRRRAGCDGTTSPTGCDMRVLRDYSAHPGNVVLAHVPDAGAAGSPPRMSAAGVTKLAAFLWGAGPRAFFADVPPLRGQRAHWQCDEWAAAPLFAELAKPLGTPTAQGASPAPGLYTRSFSTGAHLTVDTRGPSPTSCIVWGDGDRSGDCPRR